MQQKFTGNNETETRTLVPVIKQRRAEWDIPPIDARARLLAQKREEEKIRVFCEGTTPQGREILRRIIFRAEKLLEDKGHSDAQIATSIYGEFKNFEILHEEFLLLLSRLWRVDLAKLRKVPLKQVAMLLLIRIKVDLEIRMRKNNK